MVPPTRESQVTTRCDGNSFNRCAQVGQGPTSLNAKAFSGTFLGTLVDLMSGAPTELDNSHTPAGVCRRAPAHDALAMSCVCQQLTLEPPKEYPDGQQALLSN